METPPILGSRRCAIDPHRVNIIPTLPVSHGRMNSQNTACPQGLTTQYDLWPTTYIQTIRVRLLLFKLD